MDAVKFRAFSNFFIQAPIRIKIFILLTFIYTGTLCGYVLYGTAFETKTILYLVTGLGAIFSLIAWMTMRSRSRKQDRVVAAYARFCRALQRTGLGRSAGEGPTDHLRRVAEKRPDLAPAAQNIVDEYVALRYRPRGGSPEELERLVAEFIRRF